jgi:AcrR family transcriptional regulator
MQQRSEETRKKIIDAASDLFSARGYARTSVDMICRTAGISKGAFYHHYPEKHALFMELLQSWLDEIKVRLDQTFTKSSDLPQSLTEISVIFDELIDASRLKIPLMLDFWRDSLTNPLLWHRDASPFSQYQSYFQQIELDQCSNQIGGSMDPETISRIILAFSLGIIAAGMLSPDNDWNNTAANGFNLIFDNISRSEK